MWQSPTVGGPSDREGLHEAAIPITGRATPIIGRATPIIGRAVQIIERTISTRTRSVVGVTRTDRGEERRRLLRAVRTDAESDSAAETADDTDRPEPAPDGGIVDVDAPLVHCASCDRTHRSVPERCRGCGAATFVESSTLSSGDAE